jgi:hypothetical protein
MNKNYFIAILSLVFNFAVAQIEQTSYRGAFAPAPAAMWTDNWTNYDPQTTVYPTATVNVSADITANTTWTTGTTYLLTQLIYVRNNATLTIQPGVIVRGAAGSALIVTRGAKLNANANATNPIVFTSNQAAGSRNRGDWGGVVLLGRGEFNVNNGVNNIEGIAASVLTEYGGGTTPDVNDNSGTLRYIRIEYGGFVFSPNNEINGLTMGAVGRGTTIDYIQVSFTNDDAFEWFGGSVNCKHLVSYRNLDDDFDTDNGFSGNVQYALAVRDPQISDNPSVSTSEGFESDNNAAGSAVTPATRGIFTNCTLIGPSFRLTLPSGGTLASGYKRGARIRRASQLKIFNSIFMDFPEGVHVDGVAAENNAVAGTLKFKNNILAGITNTSRIIQITTPGTTTVGNNPAFNMSNWYIANANSTYTTNVNLLTSPYDTNNAQNYSGLDYRPGTASDAASGADFTDSSFNGILIQAPAVVSDIDFTSYRGAFAPAPTPMWTNGWTNYDPQNTVYSTTGITVSGTINTNTTWTTGNTYLLQGVTTVKDGATLTIQPGVTIRGAGPGSALVITKGCKLNAIGTATSPIVFTSNQPVGSRARGDWGGVVLLGRGSYNVNNGIGFIEGFAQSADTEYGGGTTPDDNDNSGTLKYVRIEYTGFVYAPNNEINALTMGAVGRGTTIDYVQVSFGNDDAFEWFGGSVNCKHLVSYRNLDDDFDTDNGYNGKVQYAFAVRDPQVSDNPSVSTSEGFESDNNAAGSTATPATSAIFTNCTLVGPTNRLTLPNGGTLATGYKRGARIRRASALSIHNSIFMDFVEGVHIDGVASENNAVSGSLKFKNNILAGITNTARVLQITAPGTLTAGNNPAFNITTWYAANNNNTLTTSAGILTLPYDATNAQVYTGLDYRPGIGSPALSGADFTGLVPVTAPQVVTPLNFCKGQVATALTATLTGGTSLRWYTAATGGTFTTTAPVPTTTLAPSTRSFFVSQVYANGSESPRAEIVVNVNTVLLAPGIITGTAAQGALVATTTPATYTIAPVAGAVSYIWTAPLGVNIVGGQGTETVTVNFNNVPAGAGTIGNLAVQAVNAAGCASPARTLALTKALPSAPLRITMTNPASATPTTAITNFGRFIGQPTVLTLTATPVATATSYVWNLPAGVTQLSGGTTNEITVNFANYVATSSAPIVTYLGVKSKNGTGESVTANATAPAPFNTSTFKLLKISAAIPAAPSRITLTDGVSPTAITNVSRFIGTTTPFTLTASTGATSTHSSFAWELPAGVNQLSGGTTGVITINFAGVAPGVTTFYLGCKSVNGVGSSITNNATANPATASTAKLLKISAAIPAAVSMVTGQLGGVCINTAYNYTITASPLATSYTITAPVGFVVTSPSNTTNSSNILTTPDATFTILTPSVLAASSTFTIVANNGVGSSAAFTRTLTTALPLVGVIAGGTTFSRCAPQVHSVPAIIGATNYTWNVTAGAIIVSGQGTNSVTVDFSEVLSTVTRVSISVSAQNACGTSTPVKSSNLASNSTPCARMAQVATTNTTSEIYPNPSSDFFNVDFTSEINEDVQMSIYTINGSLISSRVISITEGSNTVNENISSFNSGIYIVQFNTSKTNQTIVRKLVKK